MRAILFDLDGVFYLGGEAIAGAAEVLAWVREGGIPHLFLTNTTSRPRSAIAGKLADMGMEVGESEILTPPVAAVSWVRQHAMGPVALFVPGATRAEFVALPLLDDAREKGASAVVIGDLGEAWDYLTLNRAFRLLMATPPPRLVALGMTRYWQASDGLRLDTAPFVKALSHASGVEPVILGKPDAAFFQAALDLLGVAADECLMIGDDIRGDVAGAQAAGLRALLVRTGKFQTADLDGDVVPDAVLGSIAELPAWWRAEPGDGLA
ncbi:MAG: TIGR01458 family HAD-type hydrolase [Candidatus Sedimenticola sp. 20ELBAFRAG]